MFVLNEIQVPSKLVMPVTILCTYFKCRLKWLLQWKNFVPITSAVLNSHAGDNFLCQLQVPYEIVTLVEILGGNYEWAVWLFPKSLVIGRKLVTSMSISQGTCKKMSTALIFYIALLIDTKVGVDIAISDSTCNWNNKLSPAWLFQTALVISAKSWHRDCCSRWFL